MAADAPRNPKRNRPHNPYRHLATESVLAAIDAMSWDRADIAANPDAWDHPNDTGAYLDLQLADATSEISRREALRHLPFAPAWPDRRGELDEIKRRVDIADFIERNAGVSFMRRGRRLVCRCPFPDHDDSDPSFGVVPDKQTFHCFGCHRGGDVFAFALAWFGSICFRDAVDLVAHHAGIRSLRRRSGNGGFGRPREGKARVG